MLRSVFHTSFRLTHPPSGIRIEISCRGGRDLVYKKELAMKLLRSKLYMHRYPELGVEKVYDLPDEDPYPHELIEYRCNAYSR